MSKPREDVLPTYNRVATGWDLHRDCSLFEKPYLDRFLALAPGQRVLCTRSGVRRFDLEVLD
ncbi:MAG: hypothetical protein P8R45_12360 [Candidatus Binatia bacterium]|nr:hypothetical protein [Candidatus Binatia bacterium]